MVRSSKNTINIPLYFYSKDFDDLGYDLNSDRTVFFITVSIVRIIRDRLHPASALGIEGN
jgi:hypothetical protein